MQKIKEPRKAKIGIYTMGLQCYWAQFEGPVAQAASTMNDTYLKANGQQDGVKSYGKVTDLLLSYYKQQTQ